ncbi:hypothetical protein EDC04DRAFT_902333 [Pisolithus marmoratus]|nr:hypothetical protein EDC04DRAFT_902333 [Pisolithus marmoratus]
MFWRFGFHNASAIDSLLDKDVSLEAILDEDDLLQECKAQNTRLIDFFQRTDVLKRLLGYVTGQIEGHEERGRFNEIWSIVETCVNNAEELLAPFWETVLDKSPEDMKTEMVMASHFAKVNSVFLTKTPAEVSDPRHCSMLSCTRYIISRCLPSSNLSRNREALAAPCRGTFHSGPIGSHRPIGRTAWRIWCSRMIVQPRAVRQC